MQRRRAARRVSGACGGRRASSAQTLGFPRPFKPRPEVCASQARSEAREWRLRRQAGQFRAELAQLRGQRAVFPTLPSPLERCLIPAAAAHLGCEGTAFFSRVPSAAGRRTAHGRWLPGSDSKHVTTLRAAARWSAGAAAAAWPALWRRTRGARWPAAHSCRSPSRRCAGFTYR